VFVAFSDPSAFCLRQKRAHAGCNGGSQLGVFACLQVDAVQVAGDDHLARVQERTATLFCDARIVLGKPTRASIQGCEITDYSVVPVTTVKCGATLQRQ
jgi:hypothetical protein